MKVVGLAHHSANPVDVKAFARQRLAGAPVTIRLDAKGTTARSYGLEYYPQFIALSPQGKRIAMADSFEQIIELSGF